VPNIDPSDEEKAAVIAALKEKLDRVRFGFGWRRFASALAKIDPSAPQPRPVVEKPPLPEAPARARGGRHTRR